jgi:cytochrome oxidase assembly protein ShyY1
VLRTLLTPRWLGLLALATAVAVATVWLGSWQYGRHEERVAHRDLVEAHYGADPVPMETVLPPGASLDPGAEWTRVTATGSYDAASRLFVRNRPHRGTYGYQVLGVLRTPAGNLLVDRGWVPNAARAEELPQVDPDPVDPVEVTGWLRPSEPDLGRDLPEGQLASIDVAGAEEQLGIDLLDGYLVLASEQLPDGSVPSRPEPAEPPSTDLGPHFAYALQWWLTSPVGFVLVWVFARREHLEQTGRARPAAAAGAPRQRRTRIWDEEDG